MKNKTGMYWETPQLVFGKYTISYMRDGETDRIWIQKENQEWWEFLAKGLEEYIWEFFDKYF